MVKTNTETATPDQSRTVSVALYLAAKILSDVFGEAETPGTQLATRSLEPDPGEARALVEFIHDFMFDLRVQSGGVRVTDEETDDFELTEFGLSLSRAMNMDAAILPEELWADLQSVAEALSQRKLESSALRKLVEMGSPEYLELPISQWDVHRVADLILRNSPLFRELKVKTGVVEEEVRVR
jgi:hypothetical protein